MILLQRKARPEKEKDHSSTAIIRASQLDAIYDIADSNPKKACEDILRNPTYFTDLAQRLQITKKNGWISDTLTCPSASRIKQEILAYKKDNGLPIINEKSKILKRFVDFSKGNVTDDEIYQKFIELAKPFSNIHHTYYRKPTAELTTELSSIIDAYNQELQHNPVIVAPGGAITGGATVNINKIITPILAVINNLNNSDDHVYTQFTNFVKYVTENRPSLGLGPMPQSGSDRDAMAAYIRNAITTISKQTGGRRSRYKIAAPTRKMKKQRGGGVTMPLGFYQDGAQMRGTYGSETGVGLGVMTANMARSALLQTGGRKKVTRKAIQKQKQGQQSQRGGFAPSVMGSFASNGLSLLPVASFMGYRMMNKGNKTRKGKAGRTGRKRQTRR